MHIDIRPLHTIDEYRAAETLQCTVWNIQNIRVVPDAVLLTTQKNGGLVLGAFDMGAGPEHAHLVGYLYGFVGLTHDGTVKHCSHQLGVLPGYQDQNVGYRLKLAQREYVLAQGISLITWTYDPLESRNAYLNLHKLGTTCRAYLRNIYGEMRDGLNSGLPSDRFEVEWHINSRHVARRLEAAAPSLTLDALQQEGVPVLNSAHSDPRTGAPLAPLADPLPIEGARLLIQVPATFQSVKAADLDIAASWRQQTRALFEEAFARNYTATDMLSDGQERYYLLEKDWSIV
jgi:predicted GNAT superfamily acetyltransferase